MRRLLRCRRGRPTPWPGGPLCCLVFGLLVVLSPAVVRAQRVSIQPVTAPAIYRSLGATGLHVDIQGIRGANDTVEFVIQSNAADWLVPHSVRMARWVESEHSFEIVWDSRYDPATRVMSGSISHDGIYTVLGLSRVGFVYGAQERLFDLLSENPEIPRALPDFGIRLCQRILCFAINYPGWTDEWSGALGREVTVSELEGHFGGVCDMCGSMGLVPLVFPEGPLIHQIAVGPPDLILPPLDCPDADGDTVYDCLERCIGSNPNLADSDGDGLDDGAELALGTKVYDSDSDSDTLGDHDEVFVLHTNPLMSDTDGDGLGDAVEINLLTNPLDPDSDGDGLPDDWELEDPIGLGVNPRHKDLIVEVDWMCVDTDPANGACDSGEKNYKPSMIRQNQIADVFANGPVGGNPDGVDGINLILRVSATGIPLSTPAFDYVSNPLFEVDTYGNQQFTQAYYDLKDQHRDPDLIGISRYCLFIDEFADNQTGMAEEIPSDDFVISLGNSSIDGGWPREQVGAFLHELGHTLGLYHGGSQGEGCHPRNFEPNYPSVMNYWHTFAGTQGSWSYGDPPSASECGDDNTAGHLCFVSSSTMISSQQTYSQGLLQEVDEWHLDETAGFASIPSQDLNFDGTLNTRVQVDVQGDGCMEVLDDFNDWASFVYKVW